MKDKADAHGLLLMEVSDAHNLENIGLRYTELDLRAALRPGRLSCRSLRPVVAMRPFETLIYEKEDGVAHISLARPAVLNAYNIQMRRRLFRGVGGGGRRP